MSEINLEKPYDLLDLKNIFLPYDIPEFFYNRKVFNEMFLEFFNHENGGIVVLQFRKRFLVNIINYGYHASQVDPKRYAGKRFIDYIFAASLVLWGYSQNKLNEAIDKGIEEAKNYLNPSFYPDMSNESFELDWVEAYVDIESVIKILEFTKLPHNEIPEDVPPLTREYALLLRDAVQFSMLFSNIHSYGDNIDRFTKYAYAMHGINSVDKLFEIINNTYLVENPTVVPQTEYTKKLIEVFKKIHLPTLQARIAQIMGDRNFAAINATKIEQCAVLPNYIF